MNAGPAIWRDATFAAAVFAVDPVGIGGIRVRSGAGPVRDRWFDILRDFLPSQTVLRKLPPGISDARLLGGIDLPATLEAGRPVLERGLLAESDGGVLLIAMAERLPPSTAAHLNAAVDSREIIVERDGMSQRLASAFGVVAFDEGTEDEQAPASLCDRLALHVSFGPLTREDIAVNDFQALDVVAARRRLSGVAIPPEAVEALCSVALSLGVTSLRAALQAIRVARAAAALDGEDVVRRAHVELAARLALAPRTTTAPAPPEVEGERADQETQEADEIRQDERALDDVVLEAAHAAIPPDLLRRLQDGEAVRRRVASSGRQGAFRTGPKRGRPIGTRRGEMRAGARLNVLETLRAAAPWQSLRLQSERNIGPTKQRLVIRKDDFRITRFKQKSATATIFVVDASGSSALQRLAEAKGAVELLLADCYVRRDEVALIAFRGRSADLILPPTRSLARAKRSLAALPGGGGTPLSAAILAATTIALAVRNKGHLPTVVLLTDGRANVSRDGSPGRAAAEAEAREAARHFRACGISSVIIDTSPRPQPQAKEIAIEMRARYVALPQADAARLSRAVRADMRGG